MLPGVGKVPRAGAASSLITRARPQVVTHAGERFEKYGCVLYTAVALSALLDAGDTVVPISHVRRRDEGPVKQILGSFPNIDTSGVTSQADQGDVVELRYVDQNRRIERQASFMNPILPADVDQVLDADVFVCVPITDYEVGQPTLRHIKEHSRAPVVLDAHGPAMTLTRSGERHPRVWADREVWLPYIDILKMNLDEAGSAWLGQLAEVAADRLRLSDEDLRDLARHCLDRGVGAVCVTLDERGCVAFFRGDSGGIAEQFVDRIEVEHVVDTTGAGDSFAGDWPTATLRTGITSWPASSAMRWALSAAPARIWTFTCHERKPSGRSSRRTALDRSRRFPECRSRRRADQGAASSHQDEEVGVGGP